MLPDFPSFKTKIELFSYSLLSENMHDNNFLSSMHRVIIFEGRGFSKNSTKEGEKTEGLKKISSEIVITYEDILKKGLSIYFEKMIEGAKNMQNQSVEVALKTINEETSNIGNVLHKNYNLLPELILDGIEKIRMDFDDDGTPLFPTIFLSSKQLSFLNNNLKNHLKNNPEYLNEMNKKMNEVLELKRSEWVDRENNRKLVD